MAGGELTREVALRVGLAARVLPGVEARDLLLILMDTLGRNLTEHKLSKITVTDLRTALTSVDGEEDTEDTTISKEAMKLAVRYLWGEEVVEPDLPDLQEFHDGDMPGSIRVALASTTGEELDGHFGSCPRYLVYQVSPDEVRLIDIRPSDGADESDDRNAFRANLIKDCHVLYVQSIGGPAAAKVVRAGIYPMKEPEGGKASELVAKLQAVMAGTPPPWLAKVMGHKVEERIRYAQG